MSILSEQIKAFERWQQEIEIILNEKNNIPALELTKIIYGSERTDKLVGQLVAPIYKDTIATIKRFQTTLREQKVEIDNLKKDCYLYRYNLGTHFYPGCVDPCTDGFYTSDCEYCSCVMGRSTSHSPEGQDAHGLCIGNPKVKDELEKLRTKYGIHQ